MDRNPSPRRLHAPDLVIISLPSQCLFEVAAPPVDRRLWRHSAGEVTVDSPPLNRGAHSISDRMRTAVTSASALRQEFGA
jgi:hypothetical protein